MILYINSAPTRIYEDLRLATEMKGFYLWGITTNKERQYNAQKWEKLRPAANVQHKEENRAFQTQNSTQLIYIVADLLLHDSDLINSWQQAPSRLVKITPCNRLT